MLTKVVSMQTKCNKVSPPNDHSKMVVLLYYCARREYHLQQDAARQDYT